MKRREFITLLGGAAAVWPLAARAQQAGKLPTIGFLSGPTASAAGQWVTTFKERLRELGWIEGRTVAIEVRWAEGRPERYTEIAAEFVRLKVDVIVTVGGAVSAAKQATSVIPIVFAAAADPLGSSMVASLARPGGNVTGLSIQATDVAGKRVDGSSPVGDHCRRWLSRRCAGDVCSPRSRPSLAHARAGTAFILTRSLRQKRKACPSARTQGVEPRGMGEEILHCRRRRA
jgi:ABC transporter substrate binding protein